MIEKRHDTIVPAAMLRGHLKKKAMECPECGAPVFRYKGSYRKRCPNCGHPLRVLSTRDIKRSGMDKREQPVRTAVVGRYATTGAVRITQATTEAWAASLELPILTLRPYATMGTLFRAIIVI